MKKERLDVTACQERALRLPEKSKSDHYVRNCFVDGQREDKAGSTLMKSRRSL